MAFTYQFSVGTMTVQDEGATQTPIGVGVMTEISISYDGDPQSFYGGDYRYPLAIELGNRSGEVTGMSSRWTVEDSILTNNYVNVSLGFGNTGGGLTGTIGPLKITSYNVSSTQNDFVTSDITANIASPSHIQKGTTPPTWNALV
jgi:hypothetical protein